MDGIDRAGAVRQTRAHDLQRFFLENLPDQGPVRVVHGDYGLHNTLIGPDCTVAAVVDWEISTLGDPLADAAYALTAWPDPGDSLPLKPDSATSVSGFPTRSQLARRYAERTGRDLSRLNYYIGFNRWKTAAIIHGVYARYMEGKKSAEGVDLDGLRKRISDSLMLAQEAVRPGCRAEAHAGTEPAHRGRPRHNGHVADGPTRGPARRSGASIPARARHLRAPCGSADHL